MHAENHGTLSAYDLRTEYRTTPIGIGETAPRFSWRLSSETRGARQTGYRITVHVVSFLSDSSTSLVWDSGWQLGDDNLVVYSGSPLVSTSRYLWYLELRDEHDDEFASGDSWFEAGLLSPTDYQAVWIQRDTRAWSNPVEPPQDYSPSAATRRIPPSRYFRGEFTTFTKTVTRARIYATAHGLYELYLNGGRVGDHELAPGWTDYNDRVLYQSFDVTDRLRLGKNAVGIILSEGWWSGYIGSDRKKQGYHYGEVTEAWAQLMVEYSDGSRQTFGTDGSWLDANGPVVYSDLFMGEYVDARRDLGDWTSPDFDASGWIHALGRPGDLETLTAMIDEPIRAIEKLPVVSVNRFEDAWILDFGQNLAGRVRFVFRNEEVGTKIRVRYGEVLQESGALYTENLRTSEATDYYITAGGPLEIFEPKFTSHGFRYAEIVGVTTAPDLASATAVALRNDIPWTGTLETSDATINQLERNIRWGQRSNFQAVPIDCPQRDERLGWMADAQVFFPTSAYNADVASFFTRWLGDVRYAQSAEGSFSDVAPKITILTDGAPAWGDAGVIIPWELYKMYGDARVLEVSYDSMRRWIDFLELNNPDLIWSRRYGNHYGDWLQIDALTPRDVLATAYFAHSTELVSEAARALGKELEAEHYSELAGRIKAAFRNHFVDPEGRITGDTQTDYLMALKFRLLPESETATLAKHLIRTIEEHGGRLTTGFVGVALLCPVLCDIGRPDLAFTLLQREDYPSWIYSIRQGATTIWERWDAFTQEHGFQSARMNSFNHYALGSIGEWLYRYVAGIDQTVASTAFRELSIAPNVGGTLTSVTAGYETPNGLVKSSWQREGSRFTLAVEVPPGSTARVTIPSDIREKVFEGGAEIGKQAGLSSIKVGEANVSLTVASGRYSFESVLPGTVG